MDRQPVAGHLQRGALERLPTFAKCDEKIGQRPLHRLGPRQLQRRVQTREMRTDILRITQ